MPLALAFADCVTGTALGIPPALADWNADVASSVSQVANAVSSWTDTVGSIAATQGTAGKKPTYSASDAAYNNRGTIAFASASSQCLLDASGLATPNPCTAYFVGESTSGATEQNVFDEGASGTSNRIYIAWSGTAWALGDSGGLSSNSSNTSRSPNVFCAVFAASAGGLYVSDSQNVAAAFTTSRTLSGISIGGFSFGNSVYLNGKIARLMFFAGAHSAAQRKIIMANLGAIYNLSTS